MSIQLQNYMIGNPNGFDYAAHDFRAPSSVRVRRHVAEISFELIHLTEARSFAASHRRSAPFGGANLHGDVSVRVTHATSHLLRSSHTSVHSRGHTPPYLQVSVLWEVASLPDGHLEGPVKESILCFVRLQHLVDQGRAQSAAAGCCG